MRAIGSSLVDPYSALRGRRRRSLRPAARRRERSGAAHARRDRRRRERARVHRAGEGGRAARLMGFGHRVYKNYDPRAKIIKRIGRRGLRGDRAQPAARHRARARADRARRRVLRLAQALPERRLLLGHHLPGARAAGGDVPGDVRDSAHGGWLAQWLELLERPGAEDRPAAPALHGLGRARLRAARRACERRLSAGRTYQLLDDPARQDGDAVRHAREARLVRTPLHLRRPRGPAAAAALELPRSSAKGGGVSDEAVREAVRRDRRAWSRPSRTAAPRRRRSSCAASCR